jgi:hypothetical protein
MNKWFETPHGQLINMTHVIRVRRVRNHLEFKLESEEVIKVFAVDDQPIDDVHESIKQLVMGTDHKFLE